MSKKFTIHPSVSLVKDILVLLTYFGIGICWSIPSLVEGTLELYRPQLIRFALFMSITLLIFLYLTRTVFINLSNTLYILSEDNLIKRNPYKVTTILLSEVTEFRFINLPFGFGYGYLKTPGEKIRLSFLMHNLIECIQSLEKYLHTHDMESVFKKEEISAFKHQALIADFHLRETFLIIKPLTYIICGFLILGVVTTFWFWQIPLLFALVWIILSVTFPCIGFLCAYIIITRAVSKQLSSHGSIAQTFETAKVYSATGLFTFSLYLLTGIIYKSIWMYFRW